ncbi:cold shock domain-containing protein [Pseudomonas sp. TH08]|uniref:cold-shock protein n=1 Tax=unclassified Pseudomonas TaxID=196821 RepID=UPI001911286A|nr:MULTISPECIES: cold shock domain-containing protein [unclassified Pseudomonas]MBK5529605.1 cold shock domain-containing protein [Pseudomonas sp. TH06]MBK5534709.1 cold shock domain-containing protein [Pseudomonas sp. TH08]
MVRGVVRWVNDAKEYVFITPDGGGPDLFAPFSAIKSDGFKTLKLKEGDRVQFVVIKGPDAMQVSEIQVV